MGNSASASKPNPARGGDLWLAAGLAAAGIWLFSGYFTPVRFDQERIEVRVDGGRIQVTGLYHYTNHSRLPAVLTLGVPFPVDRDHSRPELYSLAEATEEGRPLAGISPVVAGTNVRFRLIFRPGEAKWIRLDYAQATRAANGRYLLRTTRAWRRPIAHACFAFRLSDDLELVSSNYALSPSPPQGRWKTYSFCKEDFYPDRDWEFAWSRPQFHAVGRAEGLP